MTKRLLLVIVLEVFIYFIFSVSVVLILAFFADRMELDSLQTFFIYIATLVLYILVWRGGLTLFDGRERSFLRNQLLKQRIISVFGHMGNKECGELVLKIQYLNTQCGKPIVCFIDSGGGDTIAFEVLGNAILSSRSPVIGIVIGRASSAAALLLQTCHKRFMLPLSRILFHGCGVEMGLETERMTATLIKDVITFLFLKKRDLVRTDRLHFSMVCDRSGITLEQMKALCDRELFPEEAKKYRFIDDIIKSIDEAYQ